MEKNKINTVEKPITIHRFMDRKTAYDYAKRHDAKVEKCPATGSNADGFFKYLVRC